ncbi:MAG: prolipoprotein diacylglyceryl transferase [Candidatus Omnitrophica bacterium]|nr:prolipoprotein diacylglyceryl transferase [Candidatus Omnitrophota bacterium]MBU4487986.1 prolipoprotein diacylglyceryl transferase [Candidatus Omnitrophota bacterium]MCG2704771.1 prolipoprotein diacylglyceryl transferase [Candidatus Omnitrophota bacterium]
MHPILFQIGNFKIYSYGVMVALGFLAAVYLTAEEAKRRGIKRENILDIYLYAIIFGIIGARALHVILEMDYYFKYPLEVIMINHGGLAFQGGLIAGISAACFVISRRRLPLLKTADMMVPYVALAQSIGRIGCFLNGCCYGVASDSFFAVAFSGQGECEHPVQVYLSVCFLAIFVILKKIYENNKIDGVVFALYLAMFSIVSFFVDFLRGDLAVVFLNFRVSQIISLAILIISLIMLVSLKWKTIRSR